MDKIKFFSCPECGSVLTGTGDVQVSCCGEALSALEPAAEQGAHRLEIERTGEKLRVTFPHEMTQEHFISFVAQATDDSVLLSRLYPGFTGGLTMPHLEGATFCFHCNKHGLFVKERRPTA